MPEQVISALQRGEGEKLNCREGGNNKQTRRVYKQRRRMKVDISTTEIQSYVVYPDTMEIGGRTPEREGKGRSLRDDVLGCRRRGEGMRGRKVCGGGHV